MWPDYSIYVLIEKNKNRKLHILQFMFLCKLSLSRSVPEFVSIIFLAQVMAEKIGCANETYE